MPNVVRAAIVQTTWTGDPESMIATNIDSVVTRDLYLGMIGEVRRTWAFSRDRRPETYDALVEH